MNRDFYLSLNVYPVIWLVVAVAFLIFAALLVLRLIFNYTDPNPFGKIGRFSYHLKKRTDRFVYPAARFLANYRVDTRLAPLLTLLIAFVLTYIGLQIIGNTLYVIDGITTSIAKGNVKAFIGYVLYGLLSVLIFFIYIRFISSWFVFTRNTFLGFVMRVTNPILLPVQKLIPPIGMFDISALLVLLFIGLLQTLVLRLFVNS
jgi:YggT family protein